MRNVGSLLSTKALAEYLDVPVATIYRWNHLGTGPTPIKVGKYVRYRRDDVESWLQRQTDVRESQHDRLVREFGDEYRDTGTLGVLSDQ